MERLLVFADFNWLVSPELVGELCYEKLRGSDSYAFKFDENWLKGHAGIKLSEDINNYPGMQYTQPGSDIFGCFSDALPDRWGVPCSKEDILVVGGVICRKYLRWIINLLSRNLDCVENKRVKCERKNLFILRW